MQMRLSAMEWMEWNELERTQHHERGGATGTRSSDSGDGRRTQPA
jgi:hypothetical protein